MSSMNTPLHDTLPVVSDLDHDDAEHMRRSTSYAQDKTKILARLRRMEGQVRGIQKMVEEDQYCIDVLTQISAVISAARTAGLLILEDHIRGCVLGTCQHGHTDQEEMVSELTVAIERFSRIGS